MLTPYHSLTALNAVVSALSQVAMHGEQDGEGQAAFRFKVDALSLKLADGQLSAVDIIGLDLPGALVTLSACETGRSVVAAGDEPLGLSRAFLYAGAGTLVQSLWRVEDDSTARLMARFYAALREGQTKGAALRAAQLSLLGGHGGHPYLWAPFQLIGDDGKL